MFKNKIFANFTGVSSLIMASKVLGFLRDILIAASIGTTVLADAYAAIYSIPVQLFTSIGMAISAVNVPSMQYYLKYEGKEERSKYVSSLYTQTAFFAAIISVCGIIAAPWFTKAILPGMDSIAADVPITLTRIMFPTLLFISLTYVTSGMLQAHRHFMASSVISIPYNILVIASLSIWWGNILVLGIATTVGWLLQFLVQLPVLAKERYLFRPKLNFSNPHTRMMYRQLVPILLGNAALQLCLFTDRTVATLLAEGSVAAVHYGSTLFMTITSIFIVAMSTVTFPDLSRYCLEMDFEKVRSLLGYIFKVLFFILVPYLAIVIVYNRGIIELIYQRGSFTARSTEMTSVAFLIFSFCIAGYVSQEIFNRLYYALKKYKVPMFLSIGATALNAVLVLISYRNLGIAGIAGSTALTFLGYALVMSILAGKEVGVFLNREFASFLVRLFIPLAGMLAVFFAFRLINFQGIVKSLLLPVAAGSAAYLILCYFAGILKDIVQRRA